MENFTFEEMNLMCIYNTGTREGLIAALKDMRRYLEADEKELLELTDSTLSKLNAVSNEAFESLDLFPDFGERETEDAAYGK